MLSNNFSCEVVYLVTKHSLAETVVSSQSVVIIPPETELYSFRVTSERSFTMVSQSLSTTLVGIHSFGMVGSREKSAGSMVDHSLSEEFETEERF